MEVVQSARGWWCICIVQVVAAWVVAYPLDEVKRVQQEMPRPGIPIQR